MADTINIPLLGATNKKVALGVVGAGVAVSAYMIHKQAKAKAAAAAAAAASAAKPGYGYGYGLSANYGYGATIPYGYGGGAYGEFTPYPVGEAYGYGAYGYGYYNPYTGQYIGPDTTGSSTGSAGGTTPATNAQWEQDAIALLGAQGYSATAVSQALGIFLNGGPYTNWNAQDQTILNAAIGVAGEPPTPPATEPPGVGTSTGNGGGVTSGDVSVPNVVGQSLDNGGLILEGAGLKMKVTSPKTRNHAYTYKILTQTPKAGASAARGSTVSVTAQKGAKV